MVQINSVNKEWLKNVSLEEFIESHKDSNIEKSHLEEVYNKHKNSTDGISNSNDGEVPEVGPTVNNRKRNRELRKDDSGSPEGATA